MTTSPTPDNKKKKMMLVGGGIAVVAILFLCICAGCGGVLYSRHTIVGKWKAVDTTDKDMGPISGTIEFTKDGTVHIDGVPVDGKYTTSGGNLTITFAFMGMSAPPETVNYSISLFGGELTISDPKDSKKTAKFTRI